jgi:hypothetical protein
MAFQLQTLLDLRRNAESDARRALDTTTAARVKQEEEQSRLVAMWRAACGALEEERARCAAAPATAAQARTRALYRERLHEEASKRARIAEDHRIHALAAAQVAESQARLAHEEAHNACQAVEKLKERADAEEARSAERKADSSASDLAQAAHFKRRSE